MREFGEECCMCWNVSCEVGRWGNILCIGAFHWDHRDGARQDVVWSCCYVNVRIAIHE